MTQHVFRSASLLVGGVGVLLVGACSFVLDYSNKQCETNDDCARLADGDSAFLGTACISNVCVAPSVGTGGSGGGQTNPCVTHAECTELNEGQASLCQEGSCIQLTNETCRDAVGYDRIADGDANDPNPIIIGMLTGTEDGPPALISNFMRQATTKTAQLVINNLETAGLGSGIANSATGDSHPIVVVVCEEVDGGKASAEYLVNDLGVKVVVGPLFGDVIGVAQDVTVPAGVFQLVPSSPVPAITGLVDDNLVWTVMQSHGRTMRAIRDTIADQEQVVRAENPGLQDVRLVLYNSSLLEDRQLATFFLDEGLIQFNGATAQEQNPSSLFLRLDASDAQWETAEGKPDEDAIAAAIRDFQPHIIVLFTGDSGIITGGDVFSLVEEAVNTSMAYPRPQWLVNFPDPAAGTLHKGFLPVVPGPGTAERFRALQWPEYNATLLGGFRSQFGDAFPEQLFPIFPPVIEYWYDGLLLAIFAHMADGNVQLPFDQLSGKDLAQGMLALSPEGHEGSSPIELDFGTSSLQEVHNTLLQGLEVDVRGISSDLEFSAAAAGPVTTEGTPDMDIMCLAHTPGDPPYMPPAEVRWEKAGWSWDFNADAMVGSFDCPVLGEGGTGGVGGGGGAGGSVGGGGGAGGV